MFAKSKMRNAAVVIVRRLVEAGYEAYIVGGAVRDLLLGCEPKDYDISTSATPEQVREVFGRRQCMIIGRRFRLAQVHMGEDTYEVSTFRREPTMEERRGRLEDDGPMIWNDNEYGTLEDDVKRRDFTVNALYYDPVGDRGIIDMVGGQADLENRVVRVIGDASTRFTEDPVRMLRALKLVGIHDFKLEESAVAALREKRGMIQLASIARLYDELLKIFMTGRSLAIFTAFHDYGFLGCFWEQYDALWDTPEGRMSRRLLLARDKELRKGHYSTSRALALATACLPYVLKQIQPADEEDAEWMFHEGISQECTAAIRSFYGNFVLPHIYSLRVKEIVLMIPSLCSEAYAYRFYKNPEYRYGRLLTGLLVNGLDWDKELFDKLPEPEVALTVHRPRRRRKR